MTADQSATALLEIDLGALRDNYRFLSNKVGNNCAVAGVVKANAYGLGANQVAKILEKESCPIYFVATFDEAMTLRKTIRQTPIAVLNGFYGAPASDYFHHHITPVLNTPDQINQWHEAVRSKNIAASSIIHFDTGMNRLGLSADEAHDFIANISSYPALNIQCIMSHFACADEVDHPLTQRQYQAFDVIAKSFPQVKKSLANSPGTFRDARYHYDMIRPGYALYGGNPTPETVNPMHNVVSLKTRILQTRHVKRGSQLGMPPRISLTQIASLRQWQWAMPMAF